MTPGKIHYAKPSITELEARYAADAAVNGWGEKCYDYITRFEKSFAAYIGCRYAHAVSSATGALHLGLTALGIGPGDEVIVPDITWIASVAPAVHLGATPVFVDILPDTWCLDPELVEAAVTPRTRAIIAVHLYGNLCDMDSLEDIARRHDLFLIEDAAEALGSRWGKRLAGSRGTFGFFSFHGTKTVTTGEGGMLVVNDEKLYEHVVKLNNHGRARGESRQFWISELGYKYRLSNLQAAIGCAQMERVEELVERRREIFHGYRRRLTGVPELGMNPEPPGTVNSYWMPTVVFPEKWNVDVGRILADFQAENIDGRVFFHPLSSFPMFKPVTANRHSYSIHRRAMNLPSYHDIAEGDMDRVCSVLLRAIPHSGCRAI